MRLEDGFPSGNLLSTVRRLIRRNQVRAFGKKKIVPHQISVMICNITYSILAHNVGIGNINDANICMIDKQRPIVHCTCGIRKG